MKNIRAYLSLLVSLNIVGLFLFFFVFTPLVHAEGPWAALGLSGRSVGSVVVDPEDADVIYAGTDDGVYKSTDGGATWSASSPTGVVSRSVTMSAANHNVLYATSGNANIQKTTDGGSTWTDVTNNLAVASAILNLVADPTDANVVYVPLYGGCYGTWKTTNGGASWATSDGSCDDYTTAIAPSNHNVVYSGSTGSVPVFKTSDAGTSWSNPGNSGLTSYGSVRGIAIDPTDSNILYIGTEVSGIYKSTDGGANWNFLSNSPSVTVADTLATDPLRADTLYSKSGSGVSKSTDGGSTWTAISSGSNPSGVSSLNVYGNILYAGTTNGIYSYPLDAPPAVKINASPTNGSKTIGSPFSVNVTVNSTDAAFNAARATVTVSSNLTVNSISAPSSNSCDIHYTTNPTTSNPSFAGGIFGTSKTDCTVYTMVVTPNATGAGTITFTNGSVKSYSDNSEILTGVTNASFTLGNGPTPTPTGALDFTITNALETYHSAFNLSGTKENTITSIFVDGSDANSTYPSSTTWQNAVTLSMGDNNFTLYGSDGTNQTATQTVTVSRHTLGDINGDGNIDLVDASLFAVDWDKTADLTYILSDMNDDGNVDLTDLSILAKLEE